MYLAPDDFPAPNPDELELVAPARAKPGEPFTVSVIEHDCVTDQVTFETSCESVPAAGARRSGGGDHRRRRDRDELTAPTRPAS